MKRIVLVACLTGILLSVRPAAACTCPVRSLPEQMEAASVVFTGAVREVEPAGGDAVAATLDVTAIYRGDVPPRVTVTTPRDGAACGMPFATRSTYVVFGVGDAASVRTGVCNGTTDDLSVVAGLPPLETFAPPPDRDLPGDESDARSLPIGTAAGLLTFVLAGSIWAWMMRARPPRPLV